MHYIASAILAHSVWALSSETDPLETHFFLLSSFIYSSHGERLKKARWRTHLVCFINNLFISN